MLSTSGISPPDPTLSKGTTRRRGVGRLRSAVVLAAVLAVVGSACEYDPAAFDSPALSECAGEPATIGVGWNSDLDGWSPSTHYGTEGDDVVVVTNGPVRFYGLGGDDLICLNDTGMPWGFESAQVEIWTGGGDNWVLNRSNRVGATLDVVLGSGDNLFVGGPGGESVTVMGDDSGGTGNRVYTGGGSDLVQVAQGGHAEIVDCGADNDALIFFGQVLVDEHANCETVGTWGGYRS